MSRFTSVRENTKTVSVFYGIDKGERIADGFLWDSYNMTSGKYPCLATRGERKILSYSSAVNAPGEPVDCLSFDGGLMVACSNGMVLYKNRTLDCGAGISGLVPFGNKVFAVPSMVYIDKDVEGYKRARIYIYSLFNVSVLDSSDEEIPAGAYSQTAPENPSNGDYWYDTKNKGLYRYSEAHSQWVSAPQTYIKISADGFETIGFNEGDALRLTIEGEEEIETFVAKTGDGFLLCEGAVSFSENIGNVSVLIERRAPSLQFAVAHHNRIWGCFYDGTINEIYASKLGDPMNWYSYRGISTDSYAVSIGDSGEFTGCAELGDTVVFFKENCIYRIYGSEPSSFQTVKTECFGVQKGSEKSICSINGSVFYKSSHGVMRLSEGSLPVCVSECLGTDIWSEAVAGTDGRRYFICMKDIKGKSYTYVYDTEKDIWHKEDGDRDSVFFFSEFGNNLLVIEKNLTSERAKDVREFKLTEEKAPKREDYSEVIVYISALAVFTVARNAFYSRIDGRADDEIKALIAEADGVDVSEVTQERFEEYLSTFYEKTQSYEHSLQYRYVSSEASCNAFLPVLENISCEERDEGRFHWEFSTGLRGIECNSAMRLKEIQVKLRLSPGARCTAYVEYDGSGGWEALDTVQENGISTFRIRGRQDRCEAFRLRFKGYGQMVVYSVTETYEEAGNNGC